MANKNDTIYDLLDQDARKSLAELLLSGDIHDMVVIYHQGNGLCCESSSQNIASTLGMIELAKSMIMNGWLRPDILEEDIQDNDENSL